jgi:hypothetical protein
MKVKEFLFGLWGTFWVYVDEIRKALNAMSATEFLKFTGKVFLYGLSVIGWIAIFFGLYIVGWATL